MCAIEKKANFLHFSKQKSYNFLNGFEITSISGFFQKTYQIFF
jgi:hypothetical protein